MVDHDKHHWGRMSSRMPSIDPNAHPYSLNARPYIQTLGPKLYTLDPESSACTSSLSLGRDAGGLTNAHARVKGPFEASKDLYPNLLGSFEEETILHHSPDHGVLPTVHLVLVAYKLGRVYEVSCMLQPCDHSTLAQTCLGFTQNQYPKPAMVSWIC